SAHFAFAPSACWLRGTLTTPPFSLHAPRPAVAVVPSLHLTVAGAFAKAIPLRSKNPRTPTAIRRDRMVHLRARRPRWFTVCLVRRGGGRSRNGSVSTSQPRCWSLTRLAISIPALRFARCPRHRRRSPPSRAMRSRHAVLVERVGDGCVGG